MNAVQAGRILERLAGHWKGIAANDAAADDWIEAIITTSDATAEETANVLIRGWSKDRAPRLSDWYETCAQVAPRVVRPLHALPAAAPSPISKDVFDRKVAEAAAALANAKRPAPSDAKLPQKVSKYDATPIRWGDPGTTMTPEEREEELARFGGRKVRKRSA